MHVIQLIILIILYLYFWNYSVSKYLYRHDKMFQTVILILLFLPVYLGLISVVLIVNIMLLIIGFPTYVLDKNCSHENNFFWNFRVKFNKIFIVSYLSYRLKLKVIEILNTSFDGQLFRMNDYDFLIEYFAQLIKINISDECLIQKIYDFKNKYYNDGTSICEWIIADEETINASEI